MAQTIKLKRSATQGAIPATSALSLGEVAINTYDGKMYIKKSVGGTESVVEVGGSGGGLSSSFTVYEYSATANQTTFSGSDGNSNTLAYDTDTPPKILVYLNGVLLDFTTDYTASNGTSVVLTNGAAANDLVQIAAYKSSVSTTLDFDLSDNQKLLLGDDDDLQIYHDGSHSRIKDTGTGNLILNTQAFRVNGADDAEGMIKANQDGTVELYYNGSKKFETTTTGVSVAGSATIADGSGTSTPLTIGSSSSTSYTKQDWLTSAHSTSNAYIIAYGASHSSQAGHFAVKNLVSSSDIYFELAGNVQPLRLTSSGATFAGTISSGAITSSGSITATGGTMTGNLALSGTDPILTFQDTAANTDPSGRIVFSEVSGTNNFDINYNGTNDRLEFRGLVSSVQEDLVYINRSTSNPLTVLGNIVVTGTVDGRDLATDGSKLDNIESNADVTDATNVTAAGALMDSEVTNLAQVKAFDSSDYATAAQGTTADAALPKAGGTMTGNLAVPNLSITSTNWLGFGDYGERISGSNGNSSLTFYTDATLALTLDSSQNATFAGNIAVSGTVDGVDIAARDAVLTSTTTTANAALPKAGGTMTGTLAMGANAITSTGTISSGAITARADTDALFVKSVTNQNAAEIAFSSQGPSTYAQIGRISYQHGDNLAYGGSDVFTISTTESAPRILADGLLMFKSGLALKPASGTGAGTTLITSGRALQNITSISCSGTISSGSITTTGYLRGPSTFTIDPAAHGDDTGTLVIAGNLQVDGTTTTINSTTLTVDDKNITLASGSTNAAAANGAGLTVDCGSDADATFTYDGTNDEWDFNKNINVTGAVVSSANGGITTASGTTARFSVNETGGAITAMDARGSTGNIGTRSNHTLGFLVNDVQKATLTAGGDFTVTNDIKVTTTNPRIDYDGGNSGSLRFYSTSAAQERMRITSGGNVGIGTTAPYYKLDTRFSNTNTALSGGSSGEWGSNGIRIDNTNTTVGAMALAHFRVGDADWHIGNKRVGTDQADFIFANEGATKMLIDHTGNVGIGTTSPAVPLHVNGFARLGGLQLSATTANIVNIANGDLKLGTNNTEKMRITAAGNVGIGTSSPTNTDYGSVIPKLHVKQASTSGAFNLVARFEAGGDAEATGGAILINHSNDRGMLIEGGRDGSGSAADDDGVGHLGILTSSGAHTRMITLRQNMVGASSVYNVGIGTTSPTEKLHINNGSIYVTPISYAANQDDWALKIGASNNAGWDFAGIKLRVNSGGGPRMSLMGAGQVEAVSIVSGNVGIGTIAPAKTLDVAANGASQGIHLNISGVGRLQIYADGNRNYFKALSGNGHRFTTTGGANVEILNNGRVGIGTTAPAAKLQVEELGIDTTATSTTATTQVAIDTFAAATFRSARYTIQVTNSTDSTYHITEILLIHDGTTPQITEYGTIFTGSAEATFDADISSGSVRLLATPATTDSMTFKVVRHCITV